MWHVCVHRERQCGSCCILETAPPTESPTTHSNCHFSSHYYFGYYFSYIISPIQRETLNCSTKYKRTGNVLGPFSLAPRCFVPTRSFRFHHQNHPYRDFVSFCISSPFPLSRRRPVGRWRFANWFKSAVFMCIFLIFWWSSCQTTRTHAHTHANHFPKLIFFLFN